MLIDNLLLPIEGNLIWEMLGEASRVSLSSNGDREGYIYLGQGIEVQVEGGVVSAIIYFLIPQKEADKKMKLYIGELPYGLPNSLSMAELIRV